VYLLDVLGFINAISLLLDFDIFSQTLCLNFSNYTNFWHANYQLQKFIFFYNQLSTVTSYKICFTITNFI